ncbi:MAG TPA: calcium/sodium antiporter [Acidimicrobiaceae bacterium]|nr:calcium/sodium antiporter [Acidimicrobiaceae bacterium]HCV34403.1 calcium/sodium antiporter [Acidimicrobiaceae bacterium]
MILDLIFLVGGLAVLAWSADRFVDGATALAFRLGVSTMVVGALVVGFGTSAPELVVSVIAAAQGELDLGVGNVIGSNVANLSLVLGIGAVIHPLDLPGGSIRRAILCLASVVLFAVLVQDGATRVEGVILAIATVVGLLLLAQKPPEDGKRSEDAKTGVGAGSTWWWTLIGLVGTVGSAQIVVLGATGLADGFGIGGGFVGFSMVAFGTSLPELVTVVAASRRRETGLIIGNLLGSNVFNSLAVGAALFLAGPGPMSEVNLQVRGSLAMAIIATLVVLCMSTSRRIARPEGAMLLVSYGVLLAVLASSAGV